MWGAREGWLRRGEERRGEGRSRKEVIVENREGRGGKGFDIGHGGEIKKISSTGFWLIILPSVKGDVRGNKGGNQSKEGRTV